MTTLTQEQRDFVKLQAQTAGGAVAAIELLEGAGFKTPAVIGALATALTTVIEQGYDASERLAILNGLLADTAREWSGGDGLRVVQ
ncbi:hypothetical protein M9978_09455 [Sphingomonas sp. MG17]|uniref:Uncharacterized protein n=1 Tax=Sphingomonas tagetis TaxID=2949092 RepID=A0A9X2HNL5_9SPHN|nr:hypothetical protein [Sphingomonas tagetis]MCP3730653.1 hypothetical protein [Sphingomonas tagetis]